MLERLKALLGDAGAAEARPRDLSVDELHCAAAALMVEAAGLDGDFQESEREAILGALQDYFGVDAAEANELIQNAQASADDSVQLYGFSRIIKDRLERDERVKIIEMLWEVAYADGDLHDFEANLVRRVAGLIYVSDQESGAARKRVLKRNGLDTGPPA